MTTIDETARLAEDPTKGSLITKLEEKEHIIVKFNDREFNKQFNFPSNTIITSKYTYLNFIPNNLLEQFRRVANWYYLLITILCFIPEIAPFSPVTSIAPLVLILSCTAAKDWIEDKKRHKQDLHHNCIPIDRILQDGTVEVTQAKDLCVGDIIMITKDQEIPADCVVLKGPIKEDGLCRMNTASLDGESAPKIRKAISQTQSMPLSDVAKIEAKIECNNNDKELRGFTGRFIMKGHSPTPINDRNFLFRAAFLANTPFVYAVVLFVGIDTTLMLNRSGNAWKFSTFEQNLNRCVIFLLVTNLIMCVSLAVCAAGTFIYQDPFPEVGQDIKIYEFWLSLGTWYILFSFMVPISLYVTFELVKIFEAVFMQMDPNISTWEFLDEGLLQKELSSMSDRSRRISVQGICHIRVGMQVRASALNEELGQVKYIFTDKTGTLTENKMELSRLSIDGVKYLNDNATAGEVTSNDGDDVELSDALTNMCSTIECVGLPDYPLYHLVVNLLVCSETLISLNGTGLHYLSSSADEIAFAEALSDAGIKLAWRNANNDVVIDFQGKEYAYETFATLEFQSKRLRMTVVVKDVQGKYFAYCKGADVRLFPDPVTGTGIIGSEQVDLIRVTKKHIDEFASAGSRILVAAWRELKPKEFAEFETAYKEAANAIHQREELIETAFALIERDMRLIGCTAVEDQIQTGVMEVIGDFKKAKIKVMMLTGDKMETAVTIGKLSGIIGGEKVIQIEQPSDKIPPLNVQYKKLLTELRTDDSERTCLVINGRMLEESITQHESEFQEVFGKVESIICNRAAPAQKAWMVSWVKNTNPGVVLAIGDGANDVSMLQASNVGIGIVGEEGTQAALASDFAINRFSFLKRVLFVHGHYNYIRTSKVVLMCIYKNLACILPLCWYGMYSRATGQTVFEASMLSMFNLFFTSLPPFVCGLLEKDVPQHCLMSYPEAYHDFSQLHRPFSLSKFVWICFDAIAQSFLYFYFCYGLIRSNENVWSRAGKTAGLFGYGTMLYTYEIIAINLKMLSMCTFWNVFILWSPFLGVLSYVLIWLMYEKVCWFTWDGCYVFTWVISRPLFWLALIPFIVLAVLPGILQESIRKHFRPTLGDILYEAYHLKYYRDSKGYPRPLKEVCQEYKHRVF